MTGISFPLRTTFVPNVIWVPNPGPSLPTAPGCPGPGKAESGNLCIYETLMSDVIASPVFYPQAEPKSGLALEFLSSGNTDDLWGFGSWAVKAP
jgi:hypothetical protein